MINHISFTITDYATAKDFYAKMLAPLGYKIVQDLEEYKVVGYSTGENADFWIAEGEDPRGTHIAFSADSKEQVDGFHTAALAAGAKDNGAPGYREMYSPDYYGAFVHDQDGNNIEAVWHDPSKKDVTP